MVKKDIVITAASRTAVGSLGRSLKNIPGAELGSAVILESIKRSKVKVEEIDEVIMGQVLVAGAGQNPARQAAINAGIPISKPSYLVNQVCGSGLRAVISGFQSIKLGDLKNVENSHFLCIFF